MFVSVRASVLRVINSPHRLNPSTSTANQVTRALLLTHNFPLLPSLLSFPFQTRHSLLVLPPLGETDPVYPRRRFIQTREHHAREDIFEKEATAHLVLVCTTPSI